MELKFTEMCIADVYLNYMTKGPSKEKTKSYTFEFDEADRPLVLQLAGNESGPILALANHQMFKGKIDAVDLNCGCPQGFAMEKKIGSGLLEDPDRLVALCAELSAKLDYPLTVKMRLIKDVPNTIALISRLIQVGVKAITLHGRYWWQKGEKRGDNDWESIRTVKAAFPDFLIIGNGDVSSFGDFDTFTKRSGVDAVMVGYGALRNPSLFAPEPSSLGEMITRYLNIAVRHEGQFIDLLRHIGWIVKGHVEAETREKIFQANSLQDLKTLLGALPQPIQIELPQVTRQETKVRFPQPRGEMTARQLKRAAYREEEQARKKARKEERKMKTQVQDPMEIERKVEEEKEEEEKEKDGEEAEKEECC